MARVIVRARLGPVDLYGDSYGTYFSQSFLSRFPQLLRSVTLDSAYEARDLDPWYVTTVTTARRAFDIACTAAPLACEPPPEAVRGNGSGAGTVAAGTPVQRDGAGRRRDSGPRTDGHHVAGQHRQRRGLRLRPLPLSSTRPARAYLEHGDRTPLLRLYAQDIGYDYSDYYAAGTLLLRRASSSRSAAPTTRSCSTCVALEQRRQQLAAPSKALPGQRVRAVHGRPSGSDEPVHRGLPRLHGLADADPSGRAAGAAGVSMDATQRAGPDPQRPSSTRSPRPPAARTSIARSDRPRARHRDPTWCTWSGSTTVTAAASRSIRRVPPSAFAARELDTSCTATVPEVHTLGNDQPSSLRPRRPP